MKVTDVLLNPRAKTKKKKEELHSGLRSEKRTWKPANLIFFDTGTEGNEIYQSGSKNCKDKCYNQTIWR